MALIGLALMGAVYYGAYRICKNTVSGAMAWHVFTGGTTIITLIYLLGNGGIGGA
jgi:hypothetical protein